MSDAIRANVALFLAEAGFTYAATFAGQTKRDDWECDAWRCTLTKPGAAPFEFPFYTGLGLRAPADDAAKGRARLAVPGVTPNDIDRRTQYGKRYLAEVEKQRKPQAPDAASVLHSLISDASAIDQSFSDWCADFGYDSDSIKALNTYKACEEIGEAMRRLFTAEQRAALADMLQDY